MLSANSGVERKFNETIGIDVQTLTQAGSGVEVPSFSACTASAEPPVGRQIPGSAVPVGVAVGGGVRLCSGNGLAQVRRVKSKSRT